MDFFELYEYAYLWAFLLFTLCWGVTGLLQMWEGFGEKLINSILILGVIIFLILSYEESDFIGVCGALLGGALAMWIGAKIGDAVSGDWRGVAGVIGLASFIAMFVLYGLNI